MVIAALTAVVYFLVGVAPPEIANKWYDLARKITKDVDDVVHIRPRVTFGGITLLKESNSIKELSTTERNFDCTYTSENTWMGSTKRIELKGSFVGKAGYDLVQPFSIDIAADGKTIRAHMPPVQINSVEQVKMEVMKDENGIWNKISPQEREQGINALLGQARKSLEKSGILREADEAFTRQLEEAIRKSAPQGVEIFREPLS